jgi:arylsulfatase A-like enzyme
MMRFSRPLSLCTAAAFLATATFAADAPPNLLLILTDDHGWSQNSSAMDDRVPESRSAYLETPHIASLMADGIRFTSGYSPAPLCTPTRRSIQCGTTAARSGTEFASPNWIPADHLTIPKALKSVSADYRCAHFGKWGERMISTPEECGYDTSDGMTGNNTGGMPRTLGIQSGDHNEGPPHFIDNDDPKRTPTVTDHAKAFMQAQVADGKPFYVQTSYYAQHLSVVCTEEGLAKYRAKGTPDRVYTQAWAAMMEELDAGIGELLATIQDLGIADNTYVFFTTDNGGRGTVPGGDESRQPTNHPLSGAKHSLLEGGIRVPFIVRGPGIRAGSVSHVPVAGYDFLPTFHQLAGGKRKGLTSEVDGVSFARLFKNPMAELKRPQGALLFHRPRRLMSAVRQGSDKLFVTWKPTGGVDAMALHDVGRDPRETEERDRSANEPERTQELFKILSMHLDAVDAERPKPAKRKRKTQK